jgi:phytoene synthase
MAELNLTTRDALKRADPDRYRAALMSAKQGREDLLILYAFHYELSKVPDVTSEPMLGQIRYEWWREAIDEIYAGKAFRRHEISTPLSEMLRRTEVPRFWIERLIDGRARDLDPQPFADMEDAKSYVRETSGQLTQIAVKVLGGTPDEKAIAAGEAWGLTGLARSYSHYHDRMLSNLEFEVILQAAEDRYDFAKGRFASPVFPAIAYAALIPAFLKRLRHSRFDPISDTIVFNPLLKQVHQMRSAFIGKI